MKKLLLIIVTFLLLVTISLQLNTCSREKVTTKQTTEMVTVRDTIRDTVFIPTTVYITRVDTVLLQQAADTVYKEVIIPIERKDYKTEKYHAVIEGFRANIVSMDIYQDTKYVTHTITNTITKRNRFGLGVHAGYGLSNDGLYPYVGVGVQYNILSF